MGTDLGGTEPVVSTGSAAFMSLVFAVSTLACCFDGLLDGLAAAICLRLLPAFLPTLVAGRLDGKGFVAGRLGRKLGGRMLLGRPDARDGTSGLGAGGLGPGG